MIIVRDERRWELSGGFRKTTNNRMEILAAIEGLKGVLVDRMVGLEITIFSDSRYLVDMFNQGHAKRWRAKGWMRTPKDRAKNEDLWGSLLDLAAPHRVRFVWVKSHNEHPENERCDQLAVEARLQGALPPDEGYEREKSDGRIQDSEFRTHNPEAGREKTEIRSRDSVERQLTLL